MEFQLTEMQKIAQDVAREFAIKELQPRAVEIDQKGELSPEIISKMAECNLTGLIIPESFGGAGLNVASLVTAVEELSSTCPSIGVLLAAHSFMTLQVLAFGNDNLKSELLPKLAGGALGAVAISEPNASSNMMAITTTGIPDGDGFKLNGSKVYTSNSAIASYTSVLFKSSTQSGPNSLNFGIIDTNQAGLSKGRQEHLVGLGGDGIHPLSFKDLAVNEKYILGQKGDGLTIAKATSGVAYLCIAATAVGAMRELLKLTIQYAKQRDSGFGPISAQQVVQQYVAEISYLVESAHLMVQQAATAFDGGSKNPLLVWQARVFAIDSAKRVAALAQLIYGSYGYSEEYPISRFVRDITGLQFIFSNQDLIRGNIGKLLLEVS